MSLCPPGQYCPSATAFLALPVVNGHGELVGILSEADLLPRVEDDEHQHPWWMEALMPASKLAQEFAKAHGKKVSEVREGSCERGELTAVAHERRKLCKRACSAVSIPGRSCCSGPPGRKITSASPAGRYRPALEPRLCCFWTKAVVSAGVIGRGVAAELLVPARRPISKRVSPRSRRRSRNSEPSLRT